MFGEVLARKIGGLEN